MRSLEILEELNKMLIDANKRADIVYKDVGEFDKIRGDFEHGILNEYFKMSAKEKRMKVDELYQILLERHERKYEYRELAILKELYNSKLSMETSFNNAINKLRKLNQEIEDPIYYKRAKKFIVVEKGETKE